MLAEAAPPTRLASWNLHFLGVSVAADWMHAEFVLCHSAGNLPSLRRCELFGQIWCRFGASLVPVWGSVVWGLWTRTSEAASLTALSASTPLCKSLSGLGLDSLGASLVLVWGYWDESGINLVPVWCQSGGSVWCTRLDPPTD